MSDGATAIGARVERFVREQIVPFERDPRCGTHGPSDALVHEMRALARAAGVLTPHILPDGSHLTQVETAHVLRQSGLSPLGPLAVNTMAPDEGNMYLLGKVGSAEQKARFLTPLVAGEARSAFFMTEPATDGGAGSGPCDERLATVYDPVIPVGTGGRQHHRGVIKRYRSCTGCAGGSSGGRTFH